MKLGDMFNSILGVIEYFRDSRVVDLNGTHGISWASLADAGVLFAIQAGDLTSHGQHVALVGGSKSEQQMLNSAANAWSLTFKLYDQLGGNFDAHGGLLLKAHGVAEQLGETFGTNYADARRSYMNDREALVMTFFRGVSDQVRLLQMKGIRTPLTDPTIREVSMPWLCQQKHR